MLSRDRSLEGKVAIVTGSGGGIGKAVALSFAEAGADVALCDLATQEGKLAAVAEEIRQLGQRSLALRCDVTQKADVDNTVQQVIDEFGKIDILVNCAGIYITGKTLLECDEDDWDKVINTNLKGTYFCCQAVGKRMVDQKRGNIINFASQAGINPSPGTGAYSVSKAGVIMLTRLLALEIARYNIRVNAIAPGWVKTDMNIHLRPTPEVEKGIASQFVLGRLGEPEDISKAVLFLASDNSSYITGQALSVDGGGHIVLPWEQAAR